MEWSTKWDWENIVSFGSRATESPRKQHQLMEWMIVDEGEINPGQFNLLTSTDNHCNASPSEGCHNSSAKSSISASTDSSAEIDLQPPNNFRFHSTFEGCAANWSKKIAFQGTELSGNSPPSFVSSGEQSIGLKLGKRTYFENNTVKSTSFAVMPIPSSGALKKNKTPGQNGPVHCQVQGCNTDLSNAKEYHKKHKICDSHSKCPKVIVGGLERRFCQQCSRFHSLSEFDDKKRSCRKRLYDHNARRRKPQQQTIQFNSPRLSSSFNGGTQTMGFLLNNPPPVRPVTQSNSVWDNTRTTKFTLTNGFSSGDGSTTDQQRVHMLGTKSAHIMSVQNGTSGLSAPNNSKFQAFNPDAAAPHRALSLLSSNSWDSCQTEPITFQQSAAMYDITSHAVVPQGVPLASSELWLNRQQSMAIHSNVQSVTTSTNFQEFQLFKAPYEADYYSNIY
ncbi:Squamosa promoter-binding-like protein 11 [Striga hermonthica]|uniref:Squamosa promoter-binding-like protein 11 n=1 Tax=Striga hermonthica TaxID=68872 RepID=A0A9N7NEZ1_STRHE|nr:Squamosa promoter-binding-like protein 11 [Striga hermonthica]